MTTRHTSVLRVMSRQIGWRRAFSISLLKAMRRLLMPHVNFHYSQTGEDLILSHLLNKHLGGGPVTFVDVGCHDARRISSTYLHYLRGSSGLCIDMSEHFRSSFDSERPRDSFVCAAVSDTVSRQRVFEFSASEVNTIDPRQAKLWSQYWPQVGEREVDTAPLSELVRHAIPNRSVDLLCVDVEGHELAVLHGANLKVLRPAIVCCEIHASDMAEVTADPTVAFMTDEGYSLVAYATMNAYFVRRDLVSGAA